MMRWNNGTLKRILRVCSENVLKFGAVWVDIYRGVSLVFIAHGWLAIFFFAFLHGKDIRKAIDFNHACPSSNKIITRTKTSYH